MWVDSCEGFPQIDSFNLLVIWIVFRFNHDDKCSEFLTWRWISTHEIYRQTQYWCRLEWNFMDYFSLLNYYDSFGTLQPNQSKRLNQTDAKKMRPSLNHEIFWKKIISAHWLRFECESVRTVSRGNEMGKW